MTVLFASCADEEDMRVNTERHAITLASVEELQENMTRADVVLAHDFTVYGYKNANGTIQTVFDGYTIKYRDDSANSSEENTHGYYYVDGDQAIKYWDYAASEYHFWGMWADTPGKAIFSGVKNNILTIPNIPLRVGDPSPADDVLFTGLNVRYPISTDVVQMRFKRPYAKLRIQFYTAEPVTPIAGNITITDITFSPDATALPPLVNKVYGMGDVVITYQLPTDGCAGFGKETVAVQNLRQPQDGLAFDNVTLTPTLGFSSSTAVTAPIDPSKGQKYYYYPLPMGDRNPAFILRATIDGQPHQQTAVIPASYMQWQPNFLYTYIFKVTQSGTDIEFYDVNIEPWRHGGAQNEEWKNW